MRKQKGFTLIELLVVIAIIGLLSTLAVVALNNARQKARDAKRVADVKQMQTALELYYNDQNEYPKNISAGVLGQGSYSCLGTNGFQAAGGCTGTVYMGQVPTNPKPWGDGSGAAKCLDNATSAYSYDSPSDGTTYRITYCLGANTGGVDAGYQTACSTGIAGCSDPY